ncbi:neuroblast differentiation-associated protein AHNAK isoform X38 [Hippocampus zosterae]|uniref:neuroblast differentiation-associated protein AHNAK isoform X32 n=1 Tax=Hippocampus zosterae TaxID=109293 RepID=UPI00223DDAD3|nr:neuroblast differentiation-associated protein AHNAK isoform X32 [Hippocampus zosterae]XP_051933955.1 neuroblast differentiation-associated protein AHNAK isoform X33 [Hippocampus zosterae]XP_051933960.1 neuroblast differentiation-associated protein AHNAK isoform X38 [Hippocampus zosterae]
MDPEPSNEQTDQTTVEAAEPPVEIVVETEAEAGASGYSVTGGGERGIFIKDVLKDSPAAKHLSLQQGDQLLSAKVYFDNVRYEDALKILQCAEPYKVSFLVKRTVQGEEVCVRPRLPSVDIKGPKAKMTKMSVKAIKPFKAKKKRGGRFGLKRLKEKRREELVIEGTPPRLEMSDVDVEFCLPRFKPRRSDQVKAEGGAAAKPKRKIRFPRMKIKSHGGKEDSGGLKAKVKVSPAEIPGVKAKAKGKGHKFEISFPKSKDTKSGSVELKKPDVNIPSPSVEFSLPAGKVVDVEMGGESLNSPDVDFALPSFKADTTLLAQKGKVGIKGPKVEVRGDDAKVMKGKVDVETGKGDGKLQMPNLKLPKMRLVGDLDETDDKMKVKAGGEISVPTVEIKGGSSTVLPEAHVNKGGILENVPSVPSVDISFPKVKGTSNMDIKTTIRKPGMDFSVSDVDFNVERIPDEVEGSFKGPEISMPKLDFSLPKIGVSDKDVASAGSEGKFCPPSAEVGVDMSHYIGGDGKFTLPNFNVSQSQKGNLTGPGVEGEFKLPSVDLTLPKGKDVDPEMPDVNISLPKISLPEGGIKLKGTDFKEGKMDFPDIDVSLPKGKLEGGLELEGPDIKGGKFKMPTFDVSLPKVNLPESGVKLKGPELKGGKMEIPDLNVSLPRGKVEGGVEVQGPDVKGGKFKMPTLDVSLPKVNLPEGDVKLKGPELKGRRMEMPDIDVSLPKGKFEGGVEVQGPDVKGGKFKMPTLDVSLPKVNLPEGGVKLKGPELKGRRMEMPDIDVSLPKGKFEGGVEVQGPDVKGGKFKMPTLDVSLPKVNLPEGGVKLKGPELKGGRMEMPDIDVSLPKGKFEGGVEVQGPDVKGGKFKMPTLDVSLPKVNLPEGGVKLKGPELKGRKMEIPNIDVSLSKGKVEGHVDIEGQDLKGGKLKVPTLDVSLPEVKGPNLEGSKLDIPDIDVCLPKGKARGEIGIEGHVDKGGKFHMPSVDIYLPKMKTKGPDIDIQSPDIKVGEVTMPAVDVSLPKIKSPEVDVSLEGPDVKGGKVAIPAMTGLTGEGAGSGSFKHGTVKLPTVDISAPKVDIDFGLPKPKGDDVKVALLKPEGSRPSSGGSFDSPNVSFKVPSFTLPRFGGKSKSGQLEVSGQSSEVNISLGEPSVESGLENKVTSKKVKLKKPFIGIPKMDADASVSCPELDVNVKKGDIDIPQPDTSVDVERKGRFNAPDVTIKLPKFSMPGFASKDGDLGKPSGDLEAKAKAKIPSVELSLSATKSPEKEVLLPNAEVDVLECDIRTYEGGIPKKPAIDVNVPKVDLAVPLPKIKLESSYEREGTKFKIPHVDLSLPKGKVDSMPKGKPLNIETPEVELKMQSVDVSFPKAPDADFHGHGQGDFKTPHATTDLPDATIQRIDISIRKDKSDVHAKGEQTGLKLKMPSLDIACPKGDLELDMRLRKGDTKGLECHGETNSKVKGPKVKGTKFNIGMPKKKTGVSVKSEHEIENIEPGLTSTIQNGHKEGNMNIQMPCVTLPSVSVKSKEDSEESGLPSSCTAIPRIPDIDFDIGTAQDEEDDKLGKKIKIPKFGVPLPSLSSREGRMEIRGPETKYEGPKVKKAVFVLVNPSQRDEVTLNTGDAKVKIPKFQTNTIETSVSTPGMSVCTSQLRSTDDTLKPEAPSSKFHFETDARLHRGFKDEGVAASGKVKLPKVEFTSPYGKKAAGDASLEIATRLGKPSSSGEAPKGLQIKPGNVSFEGFVDESSKDVVTQHSRTQMLHQDSSASPASFTMEFSSSKVQTWSKGDIKGDPQGIEAPPWFKVPKFTLKPHSTGFLQITPEGSPQAQRRGELGGEANMLGSFCQHSSGITTREVSTPGGGGSVTVVTKTTRTKRHSTPAETSAGVSVATTHPPSDL